MYVPPAFAVSDRSWAIDLIDRYPFGLLITSDGEVPQVSHLPMLVEKRAGDLWAAGHVARANPHAQSILAGASATLVFQGPHAYVSASWYEQPYATVPTWNYAAVHLSGRLQVTDARSLVERLCDVFESGRAERWDARRLDPAFFEKQLRGIVAFELRAETVRAKAKLSQNRTETDRRRVVDHLASSSDPLARDCAEIMKRQGP